MTDKSSSHTTKERILEKAEILFAERGFHGVSIREITTAAKCNMASVHYHFANKKNLYLEVFRHRWIPQEKRMYEQFLRSIPEREALTPNRIISALAMSYLKGPLTDEELRRHRQLIVREMNYPTEAFEEVAEETLRPLFKTMYDLLEPFKKDNTDGALTFDIMSIFGMVLYLNYSRPMISKIIKKNYDDAFKALLIDHLVNFSLNGLGA